MTETATAGSVNDQHRLLPFSAPDTPSPVLGATQGPESAQEQAQRAAEQVRIAEGLSRYCHKPVEPSGSGRAWHQFKGIPTCIRCTESNRLYELQRRLMGGQRITLGIEDLVAFARAWEESTLKRRDRVEDAARSMLREMSSL